MSGFLDSIVPVFDATMVLVALYAFAAAAGWARRLPVRGLRLPIEGPIYVQIGLIAVYFAVIVSPMNRERSVWLWPIFGAGLVAQIWSIVRIGQIERATKWPRE